MMDVRIHSIAFKRESSSRSCDMWTRYQRSYAGPRTRFWSHAIRPFNSSFISLLWGRNLHQRWHKNVKILAPKTLKARYQWGEEVGWTSWLMTSWHRDDQATQELRRTTPASSAGWGTWAEQLWWSDMWPDLSSICKESSWELFTDAEWGTSILLLWIKALERKNKSAQAKEHFGAPKQNGIFGASNVRSLQKSHSTGRRNHTIM